MLHRTGLVLVAALAQFSCAVTTAYESGRVERLATLEQRSSGYVVVRCGRAVPVGGRFRLSRVPDAFPPASSAQPYAAEAVRRAKAGAGLAWLSMGLAVSGGVLGGIGISTASDQDDVPATFWAGVGFVTAALVVAGFSGFQTGMSEARLVDALNAYNDEVADLDPADACVESFPEALDDGEDAPGP